jgi:predicted short-subunit dehydrogenase-like oxidoreductase (DUF2520 family)
MDQHGVPARVSVVGDGRLGRALARALRAAGIDVTGPTGRDEPVTPADAVLLCVPDSEIAAAAGAVSGCAPLVGHTSGATALAALAASGAAAFGLHPLQTFTGDEAPERFRGAGCAVAGADTRALEFATALAVALGMQPFPVEDAARPAYHAAASIASNFLVTLMAAAEGAAGAADLEPARARALLAPLVRSTVENWAALGPERALTGPLARGDEATVEAQRAALEASAPELVALFDELADRTRALAGRRALA